MDLASIDPNIVYIVLIVSLQVGVMAAYIPGTGFIEGAAILGITGSLVVLTELPTSWLAVLVIVVGIALSMVIPFVKQQHAPIIGAGLAMQGIGSLFLFRDDVSVSIFVIGLMLVLSVAYHQFVLLPMLERVRRQPVVEKDDLLVGQRGRVTKDLDPIGSVLVRSERWTATSEKPIQAGREVIVLEREGLQLVVEEVKRKRQPEETEEEETE